MKLNKLFLTLTMLSVFTMFSANANPIETKTTPIPAKPKFEKQHKPCKHHHFKHKKGNNLAEALNLTQEQKDILKQNRKASKEKMKPIMKKMSKKKYELDKVMLSNASKEQKAKKIAKIKSEMKALKLQADEIRKEDMKKFEEVLTPEQKAKFEEIKKEKRAQFEQRKQHKPKNK